MPLNVDRIVHYFPELEPIQIKQLEELYPLYEFWNAQINVVSRKDFDNLYEKHVLHSLGIVKAMPFTRGSKVLDVGTGGGFPGIPLAIFFPDVQFTLVDSIGKKIKVVEAVKEALDLENVRAIHGRAEQVKGQFDFVVSRAVTKLDEFIPWVRNKITNKQINAFPNGILYLKGGDLKAELKAAKADTEVIPLKKYFSEEFFDTKAVVYVKLK